MNKELDYSHFNILLWENGQIVEGYVYRTVGDTHDVYVNKLHVKVICPGYHKKYADIKMVVTTRELDHYAALECVEHKPKENETSAPSEIEQEWEGVPVKEEIEESEEMVDDLPIEPPMIPRQINYISGSAVAALAGIINQVVRDEEGSHPMTAVVKEEPEDPAEEESADPPQYILVPFIKVEPEDEGETGQSVPPPLLSRTLPARSVLARSLPTCIMARSIRRSRSPSSDRLLMTPKLTRSPLRTLDSPRFSQDEVDELPSPLPPHRTYSKSIAYRSNGPDRYEIPNMSGNGVQSSDWSQGSYCSSTQLEVADRRYRPHLMKTLQQQASFFWMATLYMVSVFKYLLYVVYTVTYPVETFWKLMVSLWTTIVHMMVHPKMSGGVPRISDTMSIVLLPSFGSRDEKFVHVTKDESGSTVPIGCLSYCNINPPQVIVQAQQTADLEAKILANSAQDASQGSKITVSSELDWNHLDDRMRAIAREEVAVFDADKTGLPDYALESAGDRVLTTRCSVTYEPSTGPRSYFGIPSFYPSYSPRVVIQGPSLSMKPGECWCFKGGIGFIAIKLSLPIKITSISYEHVRASNTRDKKVLSAPKDFTVWSYLDEKDVGTRVKLGNFRYDNVSLPLQFFEVKDHPLYPVPIIEMQVDSNHGSPFTCLYRLRVHGESYTMENTQSQKTSHDKL